MAISQESLRSALERGGTIDMTTTGRRSGKPRRIEIVFHNIDGRVYISGIPSRQKRSWLSNLEAHPNFTFHLKGRLKADLSATARVVVDEAERRAVLAGVARNWGRNDLETMVRYSPLVEVTFDS